MFPSHLDVLFIGSYSEPEPAFALDEAIGSGLFIHRADCFEDATRQLLKGRWQPDIIVLAVGWPGQFTTREIETLVYLAPLARVVYRVGTWCQGITTTKTLDDAVPRLIEPVADVRLQREAGELARGRATCAIARPATATFEERLNTEASAFDRCGERNVVTGVVSGDPLFREWLCEALESRGESPHACPCPRDLGEGVHRLIWDLTPWTEATLQRVREFLDRYPQTPVLSVLGFPRREHRRELQDAGVSALLAKPFLLSDLFWILDHLNTKQQTNTGLPA